MSGKNYINHLKCIIILLLAFPILNQATMSREIFPPIPNITRFENGTIIRKSKIEFVPPQQVISKDIKIAPLNIVSARIYKPTNINQKLPFLIYVHGGGFYSGSAFAIITNSYLNLLVGEAHVIGASIEYRLAPENPIPACYDDVWSALKWLVSTNDEPWIKDSADLSRTFLAGDSAGGNIAHDTMVRASRADNWLAKKGVKIVGMALVHPHFAGSKKTYFDEAWLSFSPHNSGLYDPRINPAAHPSLLRNLTCSKILLCTASKDIFLDKAWTYYNSMKKSGWPGKIRVYETQGEGHVFHIVNNQTSEKAMLLMKRMSTFLK